MLANIGYTNKEALYENANIPDKNKVKADDMNEIKTQFNGAMNGSLSQGKIVVEDITCKNLLSLLQYNAVSTNAPSSYSITNNGVSVASTSTTWTWLQTLASNIPVNTPLTFSCNFTADGNAPTKINIYDNDNNQLITSGDSTETSGNIALNFTTPTPNIKIRFGANNSATSATNSATFNNLQIEKGSTATTYVPYKKYGYNSTESMGDIVVDNITCKNMFSEYNILLPYKAKVEPISDNQFKVVQTETGNTASIIFNIGKVSDLLNKTLTVTTNFVSGSTNTARVRLRYYTESGDDLDNIVQSSTATSDNVSLTATISNPPATAYYVGLILYCANGTSVGIDGYVTYTNTQVEVGNTATPYVEHQCFGCLPNIVTASFASNRTLSADATYETLPLTSSASVIVSDKLTISNNGILIGEGVSYVKVSAKLSFNSLTAGLKWLTITKSGTAVIANPFIVADRTTLISTSTVIPVVKGDLILLRVQGSAGDVIRGTIAYSNITVEAI